MKTEEKRERWIRHLLIEVIYEKTQDVEELGRTIAQRVVLLPHSSRVAGWVLSLA